MNLLAVVLCAVILLAIAFWAAAGERTPRVYAAAAAIPLLLSVVIPLPFALMEQRTGWTRRLVVELSWLGIATSCVFFVTGVVLMIRAVLRDNRRAAIAFAVETLVAGLPAAMFGVYAFMFRR